MPKETIGLKMDIDSRTVATAARRSDDLARASGRVGSAVGAMGRAVAVAGAAAAAAAVGIVAMTTRIAEQADEIAKNSRMLGINVEMYQEYEHALELSGTSMDEASSSFRRLSANLLDAQQGVALSVDAFAALGVETQTETGALRDLDSVLADIADEFQRMPDGPEKTARAMELMGRSGARMIPLLNQGSAGIAEMREEAHRLGLVLSEETTVAAEALNDDITRLKGSVRSFGNEIAASLIPRLRDTIGDFQDLVENLDDSNINMELLAREGINAVIEAAKIMATAMIRSVEGVLFLREAWQGARDDFVGFVNEMGDFARRVPVAQFQVISRMIEGMDLQVTDPETVAADVARMREISGNLEVLVGHIQSIGGPGSAGRRIGADIIGDVEGMTSAMFGLGQVSDPDIDPSRSIPRAGNDAAEATIQVEGLSSGFLALEVATRAAMGFAIKHGNAVAGQTEAIKEQRRILGEMKAEAAVDPGADKLAGAEKLAAAMMELETRAMSVADVTSTAIGGLSAGLEDLSLAAFWKKDGDAAKEFGLSLGKMLVQLGTMAVAYAAVAALGAAFPALAPLLGNPVAAPGLALAGAGAIAAGAVLGAAIPRGGGGSNPAGGGQDTRPVESSQTTVYNLTLGAGMSQRGMSRALLDQVSTAAAQGV